MAPAAEQLLPPCPAPACCGGVGRDGEAQREPDTPAFWIVQPRATWDITPGWDGLGEDASEPRQEAAPR